MVGLMLKDILNLKKYSKQLLLTLAIFGVFSINMKSSSYFTGMIVLMCSMMVVTSMSYDEYAKWDKYALTMPVSKKNIVLSKYILLLIMATVGTLFGGIVTCFITIYFKMGNLKESLLSCVAIALVVILMFSILLPFMFKFGVEKARIIMFLVYGIPAIAIVLFAKTMQWLNVPKPHITETQIKFLVYSSPFIVLIIFVLSYQISTNIFEKKEL